MAVYRPPYLAIDWDIYLHEKISCFLWISRTRCCLVALIIVLIENLSKDPERVCTCMLTKTFWNVGKQTKQGEKHSESGSHTKDNIAENIRVGEELWSNDYKIVCFTYKVLDLITDTRWIPNLDFKKEDLKALSFALE